MSPKRTGMHFLFCFVDLALIAPNIRWIRRFSAAAQHLIMVHFNLSPLKYELFAVSWQIMLCGYVADTTKKSFNRIEMDKYITAFDDLWKEWNDLSLENDNCPSMYKISSNFFGFPVGIQETIDKYRK